MWKVVVRGIRETFERRICRTNVYSQSSGKSNEENSKNDTKIRLTCVHINHPYHTYQSLICKSIKFCGSAKSAGAEDENKHEYSSEWSSWPEAVGWSSILAAGWVVCQTICLHKGIRGRDSNVTLNAEIYPRISPILDQILNLNPRNILPITNCVGNQNPIVQDSNSQWISEKPFGPITLEEAFKEAADEFAKTHQILVGEYELRYGIKALEEKRYKDALMHFTAGAELSSPESMFNLGLCYELGIGTLVDQKKAAKYYNDAAIHDHADALYNLGVFHAQGRGGLPIDISIARTYFTRAAKLGQKKAQHALDLETTSAQSKKIESHTKSNADHSKSNEEHRMKNSSVTWDKLNKYILNTNFLTKYANKSLKHNEKVADDSTCVFLDLLNFGNSSQTPIVVTTNEYSI